MKSFLIIVSVIILVCSMLAGMNGHLEVLASGVFSFFVLLLVANLDRISEFKATGTGVEAKTREIIQRTENKLSELQLVAKNLAILCLSLVKRSGRMGGG